MKKIALYTVLAAIFAVVMAGCSGGGEAAGGEKPAETAGAATAGAEGTTGTEGAATPESK